MVKKTKDPVCGMDVNEKKAPKLRYKNKNLFFCSVNCKKKFNDNPNYYLSKKRDSSVIELKSVWKTYKMGTTEVNALREVDFKVRQGEFLAIQGTSGSGKSTMLHSIGCLDVPTKGAIHLEGKNISNLSESDLAQFRGKKIGFVFQQFNLIPTLTALENVALPMIFQNVPEEERNKRAKELLEEVGLGDRINHKPSELSGGELQRVAIARALVNDPDVILADEPTGNLDSKTGREIMDLLKDLNKKENKTIIMVTHDNKLAKEAERIAYLKDGEIVKHL